MLKIAAQRIVGMVGSSLVASFAVFGAVYLAPGDPITFLTGGHPVAPETLASIRDQYHLNDPFLVRYWDWLVGIMHGNLGISISSQENVSTLLASRIPNSLFLIGYASILILVFGICSGVVAGISRRSVDNLITYAGTIGLAIPGFVAAIILILIFAVQLHWFPVFGAGTGIIDQLWHMTLPATALALSSSAYLSRVTRVATREQLGLEHVETARSRGLSPWNVVSRHVVRNALIPITTAAGLVVAGLIAVSAVIEKVFGIDGVGGLLVSSAENKDFPVVQAATLLLVAFFLLVNMIVDILYTLVDPRLRLTKVA